MFMPTHITPHPARLTRFPRVLRVLPQALRSLVDQAQQLAARLPPATLAARLRMLEQGIKWVGVGGRMATAHRGGGQLG